MSELPNVGRALPSGRPAPRPPPRLALVLVAGASPRGSSASAVWRPVATASSRSAWRYASIAGSRRRCACRSTRRPRSRSSPRSRRSRRGTRRPGRSAPTRAGHRRPRGAACANAPVTPVTGASACLTTPTMLRGVAGRGPEWRRERVVDHVHVTPVRRDRRRAVVAAVAGGLDVARRLPGRAAVGRGRVAHRLGVQRLPVDPAHHDPVRRPGAGRRAVGDVHRRRGRRSLRAPPKPSSTQRPIDGSNRLHVSNAVNRSTALPNVWPPSNDLAIWIDAGRAPAGLNANW